MDLSQYVRPDVIEAARTILDGHKLEVGPPDEPNNWGLKVSKSRSLQGFEGDREFEACDWLYLYALARTLDGGAKVIRPTVEMMRVLGHVELNIGLVDYAQPYPGVGVVVPGSLHGGKDCLAVSAWQPGKGITVSCQAKSFHHWTVGPNFKGILEDALISLDAEPHDDGVLFDRIFRAVLNLNLFALEKGVRVLPLDPPAERRRNQARRDERMARLAARDAQVLVIQDLDLILRASEPSQAQGDGLSGSRQQMHRRRGHWKMQAYGPGRSHRKRIFVHSYMVHAEDDPEGEIQSILS